MPFDIERFVELRPYLFHLTEPGNIARIREVKALESTTRILEQAGRLDLVRQRRTEHTHVEVSGRHIAIRDQKPLDPGSIWYEEGWQFEDVIEYLNQHVFFWPGSSQGPALPSGVSYIKHYKPEQPIILRIEFASLLAANPELVPLFCRYNSGAPRCSPGSRNPGRKTSRGPRTFLPAHDFPLPRSKALEVVFNSLVLLPRNSEVKWHQSCRWEPLF